MRRLLTRCTGSYKTLIYPLESNEGTDEGTTVFKTLKTA